MKPKQREKSFVILSVQLDRIKVLLSEQNEFPT